MNRIDRLFAITLLLQRRKRLRAADLARLFEVSERTVYRDIMALNEGGVPIVSIPGGGYELMEGYYLPPLVFTPREARGLFLAARMLQAHSTGELPKELEQALAKLAVALPEATRAEAEQIAQAVSFMLPRQPFDLDEPRLAILQQALRERRVVWLAYHGQNRNRLSRREVEPHRLSYSEGAWYLDAYCRLRQGVRGFRLDRIEELRLLEEVFEPRSLEPAPAPRLEVRVRFAREVARWVRERQHYGFVDEAPEAGGVVMRYRVESLGEMVPWLLGWGVAAEPLAPPGLRQQVREVLERILERLDS
ncbi:helix-turn-helix transcriptional regulator [Calidithermus chliarophilus]|uniref:helix-turn-helix transcriptional regulator n=1 Tax=Calidithermus chliarophilus TaxID=52023 RepID=UPI0004120D48|nr:YafY family protein [Calidithermus chliarophilus]